MEYGEILPHQEYSRIEWAVSIEAVILIETSNWVEIKEGDTWSRTDNLLYKMEIYLESRVAECSIGGTLCIKIRLFHEDWFPRLKRNLHETDCKQM